MRINKTRFAVADFETNTYAVEKRQTRVNLGGFEFKTKRYGGVGIANFGNELTVLPNKTVTYFHNLNGDGEFIIQFLTSQKGGTIANEFQTNNQTKILHLLEQGGKTYEIKAFFNNHRILIFRCSFVLLNASVASLGKGLGIPKLDGKQGMDYGGYFKNRTDLKVAKYHRLKANPTAKFAYFDSKEQFQQLNSKFCTFNDETCTCFKHYLFRDLQIVHQYLRNFFARKEIVVGLTSASTALKTFKKYTKTNADAQTRINLFGKFNDDKGRFEAPLTNSEYEIFQTSYAGGHTDFSRPNLKTGAGQMDGRSFDVNSLYPAVMMQNRIVIGGLHLTRQTETDVELLEIEITKIQLKPGKPALFQKGLIKKFQKTMIETKPADFNRRKIHTVVFPSPVQVFIGKKEGAYYQQCYGFEAQIQRVFYAQTSKIFTQYINKMALLKINAKSLTERTLMKLLQNSLYGKFGEKLDRNCNMIIDIKKPFNGEKFAGDENFIHVLSQITKEKIKKMRTLYQTRGMAGFKKGAYTRKDLQFMNSEKTLIRFSYHRLRRPDYTGKTTSVGTASYITMLARCVLFEALLTHEKTWLYCDTDSIYLAKPTTQLPIDNSKYGFGKPEHRFNRLKVLEAKKYMLQNTYDGDKVAQKWQANNYRHFVCAGIKTTDESPTGTEFDKGLDHATLQLQKKRVKGGGLLIPIVKKY